MDRHDLTLLRATHGVPAFPRDKQLHGWVAFTCEIPGIVGFDNSVEYIDRSCLRMVRGEVGINRYLWVRDKRDVVALRTQGYVKDVTGTRRDLHLVDVALTYQDAVDRLKVMGCKNVRTYQRPDDYLGGFISARVSDLAKPPEIPGWITQQRNLYSLQYYSQFYQWVRP